MMEFVFDMTQNLFGKGENAGYMYQHFLWSQEFSTFPTIFSKSLFLRVIKA